MGPSLEHFLDTFFFQGTCGDLFETFFLLFCFLEGTFGSYLKTFLLPFFFLRVHLGNFFQFFFFFFWLDDTFGGVFGNFFGPCLVIEGTLEIVRACTMDYMRWLFGLVYMDYIQRRKFFHFSLFFHFNLWEFHLFSHLLEVHLTLIFTLNYHIFPSPLVKAPFILTWEFLTYIPFFWGFPILLLFFRIFLSIFVFI